jgi:hypothetical protein
MECAPKNLEERRYLEVQPMFQYYPCRHHIDVTTGGLLLRQCVPQGGVKKQNKIFFKISNPISTVVTGAAAM